jgi:tetratricopeptide (TPR) repeat protein
MLESARNEWPRAIADLKAAVRYNPNSSDTLNLLASAYESSGDTKQYEATLRRLIEVEQSLYEQIKGTPELVDTTYASAHAYFGRKYMNTKQYALAAKKFQAAIDRLEMWRKSGEMRKLQTMMGMSNEAEDERRLGLLKECYVGLADAYTDMGRKADAEAALEQMRKVK